MDSKQAPPTYDSSFGAPAPQQYYPPPPQPEKGKHDAPPPLPPPQQQSQPFTSAPTDRSVHGGGPPISFHVYKAMGMWCKDDIVTGDDKQTIQYYLDFPTSFFGSWEMVLRRGGKQGPPVLTIAKSAMSADKLITMNNGWQTPLCQPGFFSSSHEFTGFDGVTSYKWKRAAMSSDWTLCKKLPDGSRQSVAEWRTPSFTISKDGQLLIHAAFANETELILATALAVEEYRREQKRKR